MKNLQFYEDQPAPYWLKKFYIKQSKQKWNIGQTLRWINSLCISNVSNKKPRYIPSTDQLVFFSMLLAFCRSFFAFLNITQISFIHSFISFTFLRLVFIFWESDCPNVTFLDCNCLHWHTVFRRKVLSAHFVEKIWNA